jgi:ABC-type dipeptide/oligopeptide/nickel transport system permease subunit
MPDLARKNLGPSAAPPFGTDDRGIPLLDYAAQGARIVLFPALAAGFLTAAIATGAGLARCAGWRRVDGLVQVLGEVVGSLPRMVVLLVVALLLPQEWRGMLPIGLTWALLAGPGAADEAAAAAERLGGARFVEALRAHGFSAARIYGYHVLGLNLRPVLVRQAAEVAMQVVFLEIALSYLVAADNEPGITHGDGVNSWAMLLYYGYSALIGSALATAQPAFHPLYVGLGLVAVVVAAAQSVRLSARAQ